MVSTFKAVDAQGYQQIMGRFSTQLASSFLDYIGRESGQTILDLGCGTGSMTFTLAQRGDHKAIVGVDVSEVYVDHARSCNDEPRITFEVADGSALPFENNTFDQAVPPVGSSVHARSVSGCRGNVPGGQTRWADCGLCVGLIWRNVPFAHAFRHSIRTEV